MKTLPVVVMMISLACRSELMKQGGATGGTMFEKVVKTAASGTLDRSRFN